MLNTKGSTIDPCSTPNTISSQERTDPSSPLPVRAYKMSRRKETPPERILYLPISSLELWHSPGTIDISVLQN